MKITTFLLFVGFMQVSAVGLAQKLTLVKNPVTLRQLFLEINKQTTYNVIWSADEVNGDIKINASFKDTPLQEVLDKVFEGTNLTYTIKNKTVVVKQKPSTNRNELKLAPATPITVSGKVTDEADQPLPGVTVKQKGTSNGVVTDAKGAYSLSVLENNSIIAFSYVGFETLELVAKDIPTGSIIKLKATATNLREVVVNKGYYTERQELSTGNVSRVTAKEISEQPVTDPILALEGRVPGLQINQTSGVPGAYSTIQLRGQNSIPNADSKLATANDPLYIIDGIPYSSATLTSNFIGGGALGNPNGNGASQSAPVRGMSPFNLLDPESIESIEVLKDADATAIYGSRGANGVILITTKKGKAGDTKVDINISQGIGQVTKTIPLMNTQQYLQMRHEAFANDAKTVPANAYDINGIWDTTRYTNWQKVFIGNTAHYTNAQGSISGGTTNTQFLISGGYSRQTTVFPGSYDDRKGNLNLSLNHVSANQKFHVQLNSGYVHDNSDLPNVDLTSQIVLAPDAPAIYDANGNLNWAFVNGSQTFLNPLKYIVQNDRSVTDNLINSLNLNYQILSGLNLQANAGYTYSEMNQSQLTPAIFYAPPNNTDPTFRSANAATTAISTWIFEPQLSFHRTLGKGKLDALLGGTFQQSSSNSIATSASGFASDALISNPAAASVFGLAGNNVSEYRYNALYGRVGYSLVDKYIINITGRRDGSSRFGPGKQFGNFGAAGAGWIFSREKLIQDDLPWLSFGKLRASYGITGNDQIADYQYLSTYSSSLGSTTYQDVNPLSPNRLQNSDFAWEKVSKLEIGTELGFLQDKINVSASYYKNRTSNQLVGYVLSSVTGFNTVEENLPAIIQNSGLEFTLNTVNFKTKDFTWTSAGNISFPKNKLVAYPNIDASSYQYVYSVGQSLFTKKIYHYTGVNPATGIYTFATTNVNGNPSAPADWINSAPITQKYYGGVQNSFQYKNFSLDVFFQFVKQTGYSYLHYFNTPGFFTSDLSNEPTYLLDNWSSPGDVTTIQKFTQTGGAALTAYRNAAGSDYAIVDASFIRLKNVSLSYQLPQGLRDKIGFKGLRIYLQAQNLLTITDYKGLDPENQSLSLPPLRMITLGLQATL